MPASKGKTSAPSTPTKSKAAAKAKAKPATPSKKKAAPKKNKKLEASLSQQYANIVENVDVDTDRPKREKKVVHRYEADDLRQVPGSHSVEVKGAGTALRDIPPVYSRLKEYKGEDAVIKALHRVLFGRAGKATETKKNIHKWNGVAKKDRKENTEALVAAVVRLRVLDIRAIVKVLALKPYPVGTEKEEMAQTIGEFLAKPDIKLCAKAEKKKKKKRSTRSRSRSRSPSSRSGSSASESESESEAASATSDSEGEGKSKRGRPRGRKTTRSSSRSRSPSTSSKKKASTSRSRSRSSTPSRSTSRSRSSTPSKSTKKDKKDKPKSTKRKRSPSPAKSSSKNKSKKDSSKGKKDTKKKASGSSRTTKKRRT